MPVVVAQISQRRTDMEEQRKDRVFVTREWKWKRDEAPMKTKAAASYYQSQQHAQHQASP
ncbi:hypothetical protein CFIMG_002042RA [Ceratocystis fimbriata CBS 114723]|uniref:Uncharacterized protein n=1 Tax=Ceratocystis fimbriata CBS 114723 TaxID=1035309 RepID=A0A2C5X6L9_9PEZI|nr:hypothetical protein CFIMG_002042RA [Ceratocystis fimbriata CBS 114723]